MPKKTKKNKVTIRKGLLGGYNVSVNGQFRFWVKSKAKAVQQSKIYK